MVFWAFHALMLIMRPRALTPLIGIDFYGSVPALKCKQEMIPRRAESKAFLEAAGPEHLGFYGVQKAHNQLQA